MDLTDESSLTTFLSELQRSQADAERRKAKLEEVKQACEQQSDALTKARDDCMDAQHECVAAHHTLTVLQHRRRHCAVKRTHCHKEHQSVCNRLSNVLTHRNTIHSAMNHITSLMQQAHGFADSTTRMPATCRVIRWLLHNEKPSIALRQSDDWRWISSSAAVLIQNLRTRQRRLEAIRPDTDVPVSSEAGEGTVRSTSTCAALIMYAEELLASPHGSEPATHLTSTEKDLLCAIYPTIVAVAVRDS